MIKFCLPVAKAGNVSARIDCPGLSEEIACLYDGETAVAAKVFFYPNF
jgi:hypothetical protein